LGGLESDRDRRLPHPLVDAKGRRGELGTLPFNFRHGCQEVVSNQKVTNWRLSSEVSWEVIMDSGAF
jgi:hypothetical protein